MRLHKLPLLGITLTEAGRKTLWLTIVCLQTAACTAGTDAPSVIDLPQDGQFTFKKNPAQQWGLAIIRESQPLLDNPHPIQIEVFTDGRVAASLDAGYASFEIGDGGSLNATGSVRYEGARFEISDRWQEQDGALVVDRNVTVHGSLPGGFMSGLTLDWHQEASRDDVELFAPGMIYGGTNNLTPAAIGGSEVQDFIRIREDRLPTPMVGARFKEGWSLTVLNSRPDGRTVREDSEAKAAATIIHEGMRFGAIGADFDQARPSFGYWFPGSEGGVTYQGQTYPHGQIKDWSRRYHPIRDGLEQNYQITLRLKKHPSFKEYYQETFVWAWNLLKPETVRHDIRLAKESLIKQLSGMVMNRDGVTGVQSLRVANDDPRDPLAMFGFNIRMGFVGRSIEAASFLIHASLDENDPNADKYRRQGEAIIETFLRLKMDPPESDGFMFGKPFEGKRIFLRSMGDAHRALLQCALREKAAGREHENWVAWSRTFADWLLTQQSESGGFPRSWRGGTGEVVDASPKSSYNAVVFLLLLGELTGEDRYSRAAIKAAEYCWTSSHVNGIFVGGTSDNPNIIDKEAGTLSLEAYLALYRHSSDPKWLKRARTAAGFAQTWIYTWNVPMPEDVPDEELHWKKGASTVGMQLIASGHSLTDQYMAFDADEFAELYLRSDDPHYLDVAMILLHNTKSMLALPGREYDLRGPGWMQEHWSIAPKRGVGQNRVWVAWVSTSHLNSIIELEELDANLFKEMTQPKPSQTVLENP